MLRPPGIPANLTSHVNSQAAAAAQKLLVDQTDDLSDLIPAAWAAQPTFRRLTPTGVAADGAGAAEQRARSLHTALPLPSILPCADRRKRTVPDEKGRERKERSAAPTGRRSAERSLDQRPL